MSHKTMGVYLGSCLGLGFWSKLDPAGQDTAWTFESIQQAKDGVASWDSPIPENELMFTHVEVDGELATMEQCVAAGLEPWEVNHD
jgi:hypothetical protein